MRYPENRILSQRIPPRVSPRRFSCSRFARVLSVALISGIFPLLGQGCAPSPLLKYDFQTPPSTLVPIAYAGVSDQRARFREIFCAVQKDHGAHFPDDRPCDQALHRLNDEPPPTNKPVDLGNARLPIRLVIVPGLMEECVSEFIQPFSDARPHVEALGFKTDLLLVGGLTGSRHNARQIRDIVVGNGLPADEKLIFIGYSKGASDILEALGRFPDLAELTAAVVALAGVVSGTPIADDVPAFMEKLADTLFAGRCPPGEGDAFHSLRRSERMAWLAANRLPASVKFFSLAAFAEHENISLILRPSYKKLALVDPRNDSQVVFYDAIVPGGALLGYLNADHWAVAMPFARAHPAIAGTIVTRNAFPREVLLEAIARFVEESLLADAGH